MPQGDGLQGSYTGTGLSVVAKNYKYCYNSKKMYSNYKKNQVACLKKEQIFNNTKNKLL